MDEIIGIGTHKKNPSLIIRKLFHFQKKKIQRKMAGQFTCRILSRYQKATRSKSSKTNWRGKHLPRKVMKKFKIKNSERQDLEDARNEYPIPKNMINNSFCLHDNFYNCAIYIITSRSNLILITWWIKGGEEEGAGEEKKTKGDLRGLACKIIYHYYIDWAIQRTEK